MLTQALGQQSQIFDTLLVASGSYNFIRFRERALLDFLQRGRSEARRIAGICTGVFALAEAGILNNRRATTHTALQSKLILEFPRIKLECRDTITEDQGLFTARDAGSASELALRWVEADFGSVMAIKVAESLNADPLDLANEAALVMPVVRKKPGANKMREASHWLLEHLADNINLSAAAESMCMSQRNFLRHFKREFSQTPREFLLQARLDMARHELRVTDLPIDKIGRRCGLGNGEHVAKLFRKYMALTPVEYRQREQGQGCLIS